MKTRILALVSVLAAVYAAGSYLPGFPVIGVSGSNIKLVRALEMCYGLFLGPFYGALAAFLGALTGSFITGSSTGLMLTPLAAVSAFVSGCLGKRRVGCIPGWIIGSVVCVIIICIWLLSPVTAVTPLYVIPHLSTVIMILLLRGKMADFISSKNRQKLILGVLLCSIPGTMAGHLLGGVIFCNFLGLSPYINLAVLPIALFERTVIVTLSTIIGVPLIEASRRLFPDLIET